MGLHDSPVPLTGQAWKARPRLAWGIQGIAVLLPFALSLTAGIWLSNVLPRPDGVVETAAWYVVIALLSVGVLFAVERAARRLLPLGLLLRLSLVFPDRAPPRLRVAHRAGSARRLIDHLKAAETALGTETIVTLATALNAHDRRTRGHSERVRALTELLAEELGLSPEDHERLRWAAFLHDIGKLAVPSRVLNKTSALDAREWKVIQAHPEAGEGYAEALTPWMGEWIHAIGHHHERFDGTGYPLGLAGEDISFGGRIVAVTDAFETMTALRSYSRPTTPEEARREVVRCSGTHFDPRVTRAFVTVSMSRLRWQVGLAAWIAQVPFLGVPTRAGARLVTSAAGVEASTSSLLGALALSVAGVATPLATIAATSLAEREAAAPAAAPAPAPDRGGAMASTPSAGVKAEVASTDAESTVLEASDDGGDTGFTDADTPPAQGPSARSGPANRAGRGNGGPGAGFGPGNGAGQGGGVPNGGVGQGNGNGNLKHLTPLVELVVVVVDNTLLDHSSRPTKDR